MSQFIVNPIGKVRIDHDEVYIEINEEYIPALKGLEGFSHLSIIWWFSDCDFEKARNVLEFPAPYKNAPAIMGIFATRSPVRPNPVALTAAKVIGIDYSKGIIQVAGIDANDGTPVIDLKPYTPSADRVETPEVPEWCSHWPKSLEDGWNYDWEKEFNFK